MSLSLGRAYCVLILLNIKGRFFKRSSLYTKGLKRFLKRDLVSLYADGV